MREICNMSRERTASVLSCLLFVLLTGQVRSQPNHNTQGAVNGSADVISQEDIGSGEEESFNFNTTDFPDAKRADTLPHLVVTDATGHPCFLATLNATMQVSYRVQEGLVHETYIALAEIQLPEDVRAHGVCGDNRTMLLLNWGNNTFQVNMTFVKYEPDTGDHNATWSLTDLAVTYNLSKHDVFPGSSETDTVTVERHQLSLFTTHAGFTHKCDRQVTVTVGPSDRGVILHFHDVAIAAFGVTSSEFPSSLTVCSELGESQIQEDILIPLIVACCLSAVVVIIVVAYAVSRKLQTSRDQSAYKQMP